MENSKQIVCQSCVMNTSAEEITFDDKGICNFCHQWQTAETERKAYRLHPGLAWTMHELRNSRCQCDD